MNTFQLSHYIHSFLINIYGFIVNRIRFYYDINECLIVQRSVYRFSLFQSIVFIRSSVFLLTIVFSNAGNIIRFLRMIFLVQTTSSSMLPVEAPRRLYIDAQTNQFLSVLLFKIDSEGTIVIICILGLFSENSMPSGLTVAQTRSVDKLIGYKKAKHINATFLPRISFGR